MTKILTALFFGFMAATGLPWLALPAVALVVMAYVEQRSASDEEWEELLKEDYDAMRRVESPEGE